jgi:hypothetical protein
VDDYDPMCPASLARIEHRPDICRCEEYARIRYDEFNKAYEDVIGRARKGYAHAEAVAAKLVEVICDMDDDHQIDEQALRYVRNQRDAARAEVAALRELVEVQGRNIRREVLADLTARVEGLGLCVEPDDGEPACFCDDVALRAASVTLDHVLALLDKEARHD